MHPDCALWKISVPEEIIPPIQVLRGFFLADMRTVRKSSTFWAGSPGRGARAARSVLRFGGQVA